MMKPKKKNLVWIFGKFGKLKECKGGFKYMINIKDVQRFSLNLTFQRLKAFRKKIPANAY
ncbi:hypothetical protein HID58_074851 [Brassica napus]|uniref:Uncharacterized protein n=1 Tax=Brassica napus TaxID=3708 RepID=A0ABQ7YHY8_BRANA|nr:hypothetical protein HID58_074851 [Brassica napus]